MNINNKINKNSEINNKNNKRNINSNGGQPSNATYQISGMMGNYTYESSQNLPFDQTSISTSGHSTQHGLNNSVINQQVFSNDYNNYVPSSTFQRPIDNSSRLQNLNDYSQTEISEAFQVNKPILEMPSNKYMNDTLYANMNENLLKETVRETRLHISSQDRSVQLYPDPFNYVVTLGPIVNSGNSYIAKNNKEKIKTPYETKEQVDNDIKLAYKEINNSSFIFDSPDLIRKYTQEIIDKANPYISRSFERVKYFRIDISVLPRFNCVAINNEWNYCDYNILNSIRI